MSSERRREHAEARSVRDASRLLRDPDRIRYACDPFENPAWSRASQATRGVDGLSPSEAFREGKDAVSRYAERLAAVLATDPARWDPADVALRVASVPKLEPWEREAGAAVPTRDIVVRTILGRCLSGHVAAVLGEVLDPLLPRCALAYRPSRRDVVRDAVLDAASAVARGNRYFSKLDVADCFNSLPRDEVAAALRRLGCPDDVVRVAMASVGAKRFRMVRGRWREQDSSRGCPAGLPESSVLINALLRDLDLEIQRRFGDRVVYRRYSDDLLLLGRARSDVRRAVSVVRREMVRLRLRLKDVSPDQASDTLVGDVLEENLTFLGAEVGADGVVRIPASVADAQLRKVRHMLDAASTHRTLVAGASRYATDRRAPGVRTYDWDDARGSVLGFYRYWLGLDQAEAEVFRSRVGQESSMDFDSAAGPYRKVWAAALGDPGDLIIDGGASESGSFDQVISQDPLLWWVEEHVIPAVHDVLRDETDRGALTTPGTSDGEGDALLRRAELDGHSDCADSHTAQSTPDRNCPIWEETDADERPRSRVDACGLPAAPRGSIPEDRESSGAMPRTPAAPPGRFWSAAKWRLLFIEHGYDPANALTRVTSMEYVVALGGVARSCRPSMTYADVPPEVAVLDFIERRARVSSDPVVVVMAESWLAKTLIQVGREVRSTAFFQRLRALHRLGRAMIIVGPCRMPRWSAPPGRDGRVGRQAARRAR